MPWITKERGVYGRHVLRVDLTEGYIQEVAEAKLSKDQVYRVMRWLVDTWDSEVGMNLTVVRNAIKQIRSEGEQCTTK
jgi:hypothetical protein